MYYHILITFFLNIILGLYSIKSNYKSKVNILFSILAFTMAGIIITNVLIIERPYPLLWGKMNLFLAIWTPSLYLIWSSNLSKINLKIKEIIPVSISFIFSLTLINNLFIKEIVFIDGKFEQINGVLFNIFFVYYVICLVYGVYLIFLAYSSTNSFIEKRRFLFAFIGTLVPITTSITLNLMISIAELNEIIGINQLTGNIFVLPFTNSLMILFFAYSVFRYKFLKPDVTIKEKLDALRIKILYIVDIISILITIMVIIFLVSIGISVDYTIVRSFYTSLFVIFLIDISVNYSLSKYINQRIVMPIEKISKHAVEVGKGNFNQKVGFEGEDEIAILSRQMDEMTEKLKKTSQIRENFNKALQIEVQNKTEKLQDAYNKLKESDKAKKDFIDAIAHEIYNPLAVISLSDEFINWETITPENKKMIKSIHRNVKRLISLVKEIEDFNLSGLESQKLNIERFDINELINLISQDFIILGDNKKIKISTKAIGQDFYLEGDKEKLTKVFINLIENALNFSNEMSNINIEIEESKEKIKVNIKDNGIGIRKEDIGNIFDKFYRAKVDDELRQGIGLGLPTSLEIVTKHDGLIKVESEYGKGSTFTVILPKRHVIL